MATALENAITARDQALANLVELEIQGPYQANVNINIDGRSYDFVGAKKYWQDAADRLTALIQKLEGSWIVRSRQV